jgi:hypothetical protein
MAGTWRQALLADRWASRWLKALEKRGLDRYRADCFYVIAVVGSFAIAGFAIRHILL